MITIKEVQYCHEMGQRKNQEDSIYPEDPQSMNESRLFIVCDGMGGHSDGETASRIVAGKVSGYWNANKDIPDSREKVLNALEHAVLEMNRMVKAGKADSQMGTTFTLASFGEETVMVAHVGDSRIYQFRPDKGIIYQSKDHSYVQTFVDQGHLTLEEARVHPMSNIITQVVQPFVKKLEPDVAELKDFEDGDYILLCSDGVIESFSNENLVLMISEKSKGNKMDYIKKHCSVNSRDNHSAFLLTISKT
jgi:protein phosphatase